MTGFFEGFEVTFGSTGHQYTTIDGQRFITWFNLSAPELKGLQPGCRVEYEAQPAPTVLRDSPRMVENLPMARLVAVLDERRN